MISPVAGIVISSALFSIFVLLFYIEDKRGSRFAEGVRARLDIAAIAYSKLLSRIGVFLERDMVRQSLHYFLHTVLASLLRFLELCAQKVQRWLSTNRVYAKKAREERTQRSIFDEIAEHKAATALTPKERKKAKEHSIGGKL